MKNTFHLYLRSKNKSCKPLKEIILPKRVIYRMGSTTPTNQITKFNVTLEINSPEACKVSGNKLLMKKHFEVGNIRTAPWFTINKEDVNGERIKHYLEEWDKIIVKHKNSSHGQGIYLLECFENYVELIDEIGLNNIKNYIFERYYTYVKEYRIHLNEDGYFYASRKMLLKDAEDRWHRHANNSVFIGENNELFDRPANWDEIVEECQNARKAVGLDFVAFDIKVNKKGDFIILESNSAPALGEQGIQIYKDELIRYINERI